MLLTRHQTFQQQARWALDGRWLPPDFTLATALQLPRQSLATSLKTLASAESASGELLPPIEATQEVWAAGVTYLRSREARKAESLSADVYERVYEAERPELFFKAIGWRVVGMGQPIRIRRDSRWDVPEPELTLVINQHGEIVGYCAGDDVSSRSIEGDNPLYLPQAKIYTGACALGPGLLLSEPAELADTPIRLEIWRADDLIFQGETRTSQMKRTFEELVTYLKREMDFPAGVFLMTGTGLVPPDAVTLKPGDLTRITVGALTLENKVAT